MDDEPPWEKSRTTEQLAEFLDLISSEEDEAAALGVAAERAAREFGAEAAAIVGPEVEFSTGFSAGGAGEALSGAVATGRADRVDIAGVGACHVAAAPIDRDARLFLIVARSEPRAFGTEELGLLREMARILEVATHFLGSGGTERELRQRAEREMRERKQAQADYRNLVESLPAIVYTAEMGEQGRWRYVSPQVEEILGYSPEEWLADPGLWARLVHPEDRHKAFSLESVERVGKRNPPIDYRMITRDGDVVWVLDKGMLDFDADGVPVWHAVLYDITGRKAAEQGFERSAAQQAAVARLGERALAGDDPATLMDAATELVTETEGVEHACIWELPQEGRALALRAGLGRADRPEGGRVSATRDSHAGAAVESGLHVIVDDWRTESRFTMPPALRVLGIRSSLAVVIGGQKQPFGVFDVHSTEANRFTPKDVHFLQSAANVLADAIERRLADDALRHRVLHDALTGLPNRLHFIETIEEALSAAATAAAPVGVLFLDLDRFKLINDSLGHHKGDELLRAVAPRVRAHLRPGDSVARFGGDEFGILIAQLADEREAMAIADRVATAFARPFMLGGVEHFVSASIGIAVAGPGEEGADADSLIRDADAAMYRAKEKGRARCELFDAAMRAHAVRRLEVERDLRHALERDELVLRYQPIIALRSGEVTGVEALVRWQHPERGLLDPGEFIAVAEDSGLIEPIGRWVVESACLQTIAWHEERPDARPIDVSVNLSARQVTHRGLPAIISEALARTGLDPARLHLEITESALVEEHGAAAATLEALKELGVSLVLDDFGTGYSSLAYLNRFPLDVLKIDRSFTEVLGVEQEGSAIVEAIIGMARALTLDLIAEGVENGAQLSELHRLNCDLAQGYYFARPMAAQQVSSLLTDSVPYSGILPGR